MVPLVGQSPTALQARLILHPLILHGAHLEHVGSGYTQHTHTWTHTSIQTHFLCCNFPSQQLSRVYFRMLQRVLDWCGYTWQMVSELARVCECFCIICVSMCVHMCMGIYIHICVCVRACVLAYSPSLQESDANTLSAVLWVINHTATLIYVPLLVALSFIFFWGGEEYHRCTALERRGFCL